MEENEVLVDNATMAENILLPWLGTCSNCKEVS